MPSRHGSSKGMFTSTGAGIQTGLGDEPKEYDRGARVRLGLPSLRVEGIPSGTCSNSDAAGLSLHI